MSYKFSNIGKHVVKIKSWSPPKDIPNEKFAYIDLSTVNKESKKINKDFIQLILGKDAPSRAKQLVLKNDVLISTVRPNLNGVAILENELENYTASTGYCVLRTLPSLSPNYLFHWVKSKGFINDMVNKATGASYPAVSDKIIKESKIPLPPLPEQKKIAAILDAADEYRQKTKALITKYDDLAQSLFLDMFGDPVINNKSLPKIKLGELGKWMSGGTPSRKNNEYFTGDIPWLSSGELEKMFISDSKEHISSLAIKESNAKIIEIGSLLLGMYDTAALKSTINSEELSCNQAIAYCRLDDSLVNTIYVYTIIQIGKEHYRRLQRGVRQKNLNLSMVKGISILYPPIKLQNQFAERIKEINGQKEQAQKSLEESENLFNALLQKAFKGELTGN